jgi:hypothetical protein
MWKCFIAVLLANVLGSKPEFDGEKSNYPDVHAKSETMKKLLENFKSDSKDDHFLFFTMHDYNKDQHLDGHELALAYSGYEFFKGEENVELFENYKDLEHQIDHTLKEDDINNDGKISWEEYLSSQQFHHNLN